MHCLSWPRRDRTAGTSRAERIMFEQIGADQISDDKLKIIFMRIPSMKRLKAIPEVWDDLYKAAERIVVK